MLEDTFDLMEKAFASMRAEMRRIFTRGGIRFSTVKTTVMLNDGHVTIQGELKSLRINGKLVRFKEK